MRNYELLYIVKPDLDEEVMKELLDKVTNIIVNQGGQVSEVKEWGKRRLAYEINDIPDGVYIEIFFVGEAVVVNELDRVIKITDNIMRHIIVRAEE